MKKVTALAIAVALMATLLGVGACSPGEGVSPTAPGAHSAQDSILARHVASWSAKTAWYTLDCYEANGGSVWYAESGDGVDIEISDNVGCPDVERGS